MHPDQRYLLIIRPPTVIADAVERMRSELFARIGGFSGRRVIPHVTLCFADLRRESGPAVQEAVAQGALAARSFPLRFEGIRYFPDRRTIYIDPVEKEAIATMRGSIMRALRDREALRDHLRETDHPHLTIAAGLSPGKFDDAWAMIGSEQVECSSTVRDVVLLQRDLKPGSLYTITGEYQLQPE